MVPARSLDRLCTRRGPVRITQMSDFLKIFQQFSQSARSLRELSARSGFASACQHGAFGALSARWLPPVASFSARPLKGTSHSGLR